MGIRLRTRIRDGGTGLYYQHYATSTGNEDELTDVFLSTGLIDQAPPDPLALEVPADPAANTAPSRSYRFSYHYLMIFCSQNMRLCTTKRIEKHHYMDFGTSSNYPSMTDLQCSVTFQLDPTSTTPGQQKWMERKGIQTSAVPMLSIHGHLFKLRGRIKEVPTKRSFWRAPTRKSSTASITHRELPRCGRPPEDFTFALLVYDANPELLPN